MDVIALHAYDTNCTKLKYITENKTLCPKHFIHEHFAELKQKEKIVFPQIFKVNSIKKLQKCVFL